MYAPPGAPPTRDGLPGLITASDLDDSIGLTRAFGLNPASTMDEPGLFTRVPTVEVQLPGPALLKAMAARAPRAPAGTTPGRADRL